jgi:rhodanese-related sulfurtransferase
MTRQTTINLVNVADVKNALEAGNVQVVDVRPSFDFAGGRIPGSISLPNRSLAVRGDQLDKSRRTLFVSEDGQQALVLAELAETMDFAEVAVVDGGFDAWLDAGYPVHTIDDGG